MPDLFEVTIFGSRYRLQGNGDETYVRSLAAHVDQQMSKLASQMKDIPLQRLAILAAINICHEFFQAQSQTNQQCAFVDGKARDLIERIEEHFDDLRFDER